MRKTLLEVAGTFPFVGKEYSLPYLRSDSRKGYLLACDCGDCIYDNCDCTEQGDCVCIDCNNCDD